MAFDRNLAIIIGIDKYERGIPALQTAVNDAVTIAQILKQKHDYKIWQFIDDRAKLDNLNQLLDKLPELVRPSDRLIFYFAGHGIALNGDNEPEGYLVPQDAQLGNTASYLPMAKLQQALTDLPCRHFLGILDCCFAGAFRWSSTRDLLIAPEVIHRERYDRFIETSAWQILTSAAHNQKAADVLTLENRRGNVKQHSPFAAALIDALQGQADASPPAKDGKPPGDGIITATELYLYLRDRVETSSAQTPGIWSLDKHDRGEYIFLAPGHELNLPPAPPLDESLNPYRGLESFDESNSDLFFGRQILTEKLFEFCDRHTLTVVLGASGTGKSSLVKAGLIPYLNSQGQQWQILPPFRPGESPFAALNTVLEQSTEKVTGIDRTMPLEERLANWIAHHPQTKLLVVIDQAEELFTLCNDELERERFLNLLSKAIATYPQLRLILTLRSDFEPQFGNTPLASHWHPARFVITPMTREELKEAIIKPASERVMYFEPHSLVDRLIDEVIQMPGAMPLLSFTLSELYLKYLQKVRQGTRDKRAITEEDYQEIGGVARSLTKRADAEYEKLVTTNPAYELVICQVMLRMVAVSSGEVARRKVFLGELNYPEPKNELAKTVVDRFLAARLLVSGRDVMGKAYVEPAHDALVRGWQKLLNWKQQEQENLVLQRRLTRAAKEWQTQQKNSFLWHGDPRLNLLKQILHSDRNWFNQTEMQFVRRSLRQKRRNVVGRWSFVTGAFATVLVFYQLSLLLEKAASVANLLSTKPLDGLALAIETTGQNRLLPLPLNGRVRASLLDAVQEIRERQQLLGHEDAVNSVAFSPDGETIVTGSSDRTIRLWNTRGEEIAPPFIGHQDAVTSVAFSPDGKTIVSGSQDKTLRLWNFEGKEIAPEFRHQDTVTSVAFSPDGKTIVSGSDDGILRLWNLQGEAITAPLVEHQDAVTSVAFSPDGETIVSASKDKTIRLWNTQGQAIATWRAKDELDLVNSVAFSPNGKTIVSGGDDEKIRLWNLQGNLVTEPFQGHVGIIWSVAFSKDGQTIISASSDRTIRLWDLEGNPIGEPLTGHLGSVKAAAISPDGSQIISGSTDKTVRLWEQTNPISSLWRGHQGHVKTVAVSPNGKFIASGGQDLTIRLWDKNGKLITLLKGHQNTVNSVAISPDSKLIVSGSSDRTIRLGNLQGNLVSEPFNGHQAAVNSVIFSPDGKQIISGSEDNTIRLWDLKGNSLRFSGHEAGVTSVAISPNGRFIASGSRDRSIRLWNLQSRETINSWQVHESEVMSVAFSPDGKQIISGSRDGTMRLIDWQQNSVSSPFIGHQGIVNSVAFSPDGKQIISGSRDKTVRVWDTRGNLIARPFRGHQGYVDAVAITPDGKKVISGSWDSTVRLWFTDWHDWLQIGCDRLQAHATESSEVKLWCR